MPTTSKNKKQKNPPVKPLWRRKWFWVFSTTLLLVCLAYAVPVVLQKQKENAIAADRARFERAEKEVEAVSDAIIAAAGQPYAVKEDQSCSRRSTKWEESPPSCSVFKYLFYPVSTIEFANQLLDLQRIRTKKIWQTNVINSSTDRQALKNFHEDQMEESVSNRGQSILEKYTSSNQNLECSVSNRLYVATLPPPYEEYPIIQNSNYVSSIYISCKGIAKLILYPE